MHKLLNLSISTLASMPASKCINQSTIKCVSLPISGHNLSTYLISALSNFQLQSISTCLLLELSTFPTLDDLNLFTIKFVNLYNFKASGPLLPKRTLLHSANFSNCRPLKISATRRLKTALPQLLKFCFPLISPLSELYLEHDVL
jgi:hypothetical protein